MIGPAFQEFAGRNVVVIEQDPFLAEKMAAELRRVGADPLGPVLDIDGVLTMIETREVHAVAVYLLLQDAMSLAHVRDLKALGIPLAVVTGFDDWYSLDDIENADDF